MRITHFCLAAVVVALGLAGCGADVVTLKVTETGQAGGLALQFPGMGNFGSSLGQALSKKDVNPKDVDSMKVKAVTLRLVSVGGLTDDLTFLDELSFLVTADGLGSEVLAERPSFSAGDREVELQVAEDLELKPFLSAGGMRIDVDASLAFPPPDVVDLEVTFKVRVNVNVI